jgi:uncharacterized membrane protein
MRPARTPVTLAPLLAEPLVIQVHAFAALAALVLGIVQLAAPKGTRRHRTVGWAWVGLMAMIVVTSFAINEIRLVGPWSPIHLLSIYTAILLPIAVLHARRHRVRRHRAAMIGLFAGALVIAGLFTLLPGRVMHEVAFGG